MCNDVKLDDLTGHQLVEYLVDNCGLAEVLKSIARHCDYNQGDYRSSWGQASKTIGYAAINPVVQELSRGAPCDMGDV